MIRFEAFTIEGLNTLFGPEESSSNRQASYHGPTGSIKGCNVTQNIYPDLLRRFAGQKPHKEPKKLPQARKAWEAFHDSGHYLAYENFVKLPTTRINNMSSYIG